jgi:site-specific recombinase XerD
MLLSDAAEGYLLLKSTRCSETTIVTDRVKLTQFQEFVGDIDVAEVTPEHVRAFLAHERARDLSLYTVKRQYAAISAFYTWCTDPEIDLSPHNPTNAVPPPRLPKRTMPVYSQDDIEALIEATKGTRCARRDKSLVLSLLDSCCRASELAGIEVSHVHWKTGRISVTGKGSKQRFVSLGQRALAALYLYVREARPEPVRGNFVYLTIHGQPLTRHSVYQAISRLGRRAGISPCTVHMFRHTGLLERLRGGMDLMTLRDYAGHEDVQTTQKYLTALNAHDVQRVAQRTSVVDRWGLG